ncbi:MAG: hypothetical protein IJW82_06580 [Clostridia bacterium]|nr:hypothetical protein [Clostridia bacterium]
MYEDSKNLLIATYQNISTAIQSIQNCFDDITCDDLKNELKEELKNYETLSEKTEKLAEEFSIDLKDNNSFEKMRLWSSIKVSTLLDKTTRHYAEMFFIGNNMGIFNMICAICDNHNANKKIVDMANDVLKAEENYSVEIKKFFCYNCNS